MEGTPEAPKPRRAWIAALMSLLVPGLGQLYAGEPKRAITVLLGYFGIVALLPAAGLLRTFAGLAVFLTVFLVARIGIIWDAARAARRNRSYVLRPFNRWYIYLAAILLVNLLIAPQLVNFWPTRSFGIPSGAMEPAILIGDQIIADMRWYDGSRRPERGDLVVLESPENPEVILLKRVIGLAGETLEIRDKKVYIDGRPIADPWGRHFDPKVYSPDSPEAPWIARRDNFGPVVLPEGTLFLLGDNRDNSNDSRFWGPAELSALRGRPLYIYWAADRSRIGTSLLNGDRR